MQCSQETFARLFYNVSSSFLLFFLFFYFTSIFLAKIFHFCGSPIFQRNQDEYEFNMHSDEEEEDQGNCYFQGRYMETDHHHMVGDIIHDGESLQCLHNRINPAVLNQTFVGLVNPHQGPIFEESCEAFYSPAAESELDDAELVKPEIPSGDTDSDANAHGPTKNHDQKAYDEREKGKTDTNFIREEKFLVLAPSKTETKKLKEKDIKQEDIFGDTCTVGSTSKSSSEWRSSTINCRDSCTEDPFSSSSRRSCPKWESYHVFQKYDEEMLFLDRISAQKLRETESLRSIQACPRSISERIVHKFVTKNKHSSAFHRNPYYELEAAYVAQICLTWETLHWNYKCFRSLRTSRREPDQGCPAYVAQQFQQFQVLLQRYIETEPYECGRRPEIYARTRSLAAKLLQVPEYRDSNDEEKEGCLGSRITSSSFRLIMEEAIRTFMNFLKADRESQCSILGAFFRRNPRGSIDPTRLLLLKKINKKKKLKVQDLRRVRKCLRRRKLKEEEEMEILMALIDLKVVSRVLRMAELSEEQLHWCEDKMNKVKVSDGKLHRDSSSPLFFPAH